MAENSVHTLLLAPTGSGDGLTSVAIGAVRALDRVGVRVHFLKPISQPRSGDAGPDRSTAYIRRATNLLPPEPIAMQRALELLSAGHEDDLMESVVRLIREVAQDADIVIVEGLVPTDQEVYADQINQLLARTLDAEVILVAGMGQSTVAELDDRIELAAQKFGGLDAPRVLGAIVNKVNTPPEIGVAVSFEMQEEVEAERMATQAADQAARIRAESRIFNDDNFRLIGTIPWRERLVSPRTSDVANVLGARVLHAGELDRRRVTRLSICARTLPNMITALRPGMLIVTPGDRSDVLLAGCMAAQNGVQLAGILLTSDIEPDARVMTLCERAFETGLPLLLGGQDTYHTALSLSHLNPEIPLDDSERLEWLMDTFGRHIDGEWLKQLVAIDREPRLSPPAFRYLLTSRARAAQKRIVLPEGNEPRTIQAAVICTERRIARCTLLGERQEIERVARAVGVALPPDLEILEPTVALRQQYVPALVAMRGHKGMTPPLAESLLEDNVMLGTVMLALDEVDGLVSGAVHTTANTIRPALQLIKTSPDAALVSSIFFMLLPEQVLVYGDCAVNPNPNAQELADIAIQSADSAAAFGIPPRVAMISYSTGVSGVGSDVEKVRQATQIAQARRPDLPIDGPLQYDAAAIASVAAAKAPESKVAGQATVFIFPDLNTGNTTYKAVQRTANVVSIGPMLQGLRKPVNDLSRGALIDDIVYTIALTAIQAASRRAA